MIIYYFFKIKIFKQEFSSVAHINNIKKHIKDKCMEDVQKIYPVWYDENNECFDHRLRLLDLMILILLRKNCKWLMHLFIDKKRKHHTKNQKLTNLLHK